MDEQIPKSHKKTIVARKPSPNSLRPTVDYEEDTYVPIVAIDSCWVDINFPRARQNEDVEDIENEVQIIELETAEEAPLMQLFPDLKYEIGNFERLNQEISTARVTKMLLGKKPNLSLMKEAKKVQVREKLSSVPEDIESDASGLTIAYHPNNKN